MRVENIGICTFAQQPDKTECLEAIWSQGRACKSCNVRCYRQGMTKAQATADNSRLITNHYSMTDFTISKPAVKGEV